MNSHYEKSVQEMETKMTWSALNCVNNLNQRGADLFIPIWAGRKLFISSRISKGLFKVIERDSIHEHTPCYKLHTAFRRVRTVRVNKNTLYCSCGHFERIGMMCSHLANVLDSCKDYTEPNHHGFALRWWKIYTFHATKPISEFTERDKKLEILIQSILKNDIEGTFLSSKHLETIPIDLGFKRKFMKNENDIDIINFDIGDLTIGHEDTFGLIPRTSQANDEPLHRINIDTDDLFPSNNKNTNAYQELKTYFSELTSALEDDNDDRHMQEIKEVLVYHTQVALSRAVKRIQKDKKPRGDMISMGVPKETKRI